MYHNVLDFFKQLNEAKTSYLVLRNWENLLSPTIYMEDHGDIDLLCHNIKDIENAAHILPCNPQRPDRVHYYIDLCGQHVSIDLRSVGDGYYCRQWQYDLLQRRVLFNDSFFIMEEEDYFYTLIYHAILQKRSLSSEYQIRLSQMARHRGLLADNEQSLLFLLENYMKRRGYSFTYSLDYMVPNRFQLVDHRMIMPDKRRQCQHFMFDTKVKCIEKLVQFKHKFMA